MRRHQIQSGYTHRILQLFTCMSYIEKPSAISDRRKSHDAIPKADVSDVSRGSNLFIYTFYALILNWLSFVSDT